MTLLLSALTLTLRCINAMAFLLAYTMFMPDTRVRANNFNDTETADLSQIYD